MPVPRAPDTIVNAEGISPRRLYVYNGGFLTNPRIRRILDLSGYQIALGKPKDGDFVGIWGQSPTSHRGEKVATHTNAKMVRVEDAFLRSLHPGRSGDPPLGLMIDHGGIHFDPSTRSDLETLLRTNPLDDGALLAQARSAITRMQANHLSKYSATRLDLALPKPGYVLIIDQTEGDASVKASRADRSRFLEMLFVAREEHPGARFVIKTHPETSAGFRGGHFRDEDTAENIEICDAPVSPWQLLEGATAVYTVSSQMGFEAILAGHKPRVFGGPFYAGWGLTEDEDVFPHRNRKLTRAQLFCAAMMLFPHWYDPYHDRLCTLEDHLAALEAQSRAWREDHQGWVASGMRLWKRRPLQQVFGSVRSVVYEDDSEKAQQIADRTKARRMVWSSKATEANVARVEDGFLRSRGLGAELIPPLSLALDEVGIYYDPTAPSRLEQLIHNSTALSDGQIERAEKLISRLNQNSLSKYNLSGELPTLPSGHRILVPGQVEDDASILKGCGEVRTNADLLRLAREANPTSVVIWKPHPDVIAGLRNGHVDTPDRWADMTLTSGNIGSILNNVDEIWTLTSLTGFEALLRGCRVTTLGAPFYAGWGLTRDLGQVPARRLGGQRPTLAGLAHATLIDYPRYFDPVTGLACPVEVIVDRLINDAIPQPGPFNRSLSKLQGLLASYAHLWRR
ncbi:MAG: capsular polysaccharide biosynthesis protein [Pelagimonas sp.]